MAINHFNDEDISDEQLSQAAQFFSANYGVWGQSAVANMGPLVKAVLPEGGDNSFISITRGTELLGILFATRWIHQDRSFAWVTQLCVHRSCRNEGIAKSLLRALKADNVYAVGILSSHPFSISAVARVFGDGVQNANLTTMRLEAKEIMAICPVTYVRDAKLRGELFEDSSLDGTVSCANTKFWVDHREPNVALSVIKEKGIQWILGSLPGGHEYLLSVKLKDAAESRTVPLEGMHEQELE